MKKFIALASILILTLSFAGCNTQGENITSDGTFSNDNQSGVGSSVESTVSGVVSGVGDVVSDVTSGVGSVTNGITSDMSQGAAKITADEAKKKALDHAGVKESDVTGLKVDLDRDDSVLKYEVDFSHGGKEYDYDINAETGEIISTDKDND